MSGAVSVKRKLMDVLSARRPQGQRSVILQKDHTFPGKGTYRLHMRLFPPADLR